MKRILVLMLVGVLLNSARGGDRVQEFDADPGWEGVNNRIAKKPISVEQDFGWCQSNFAGKDAGEMGGIVMRAARPAYYAAKIGTKTLADKLHASGSFAFTKTSAGSGIFFGFFRAQQPGGGGRPISSMGMDFDAEGNGARLALRLITGQNRSCGTFITPFIPGKFRPAPLRNDGTRYTWTMDYDPQAGGGAGRITFTLKGDKPRPGGLERPDMPQKWKDEAQKRFPDTTTFVVDLPSGFKEQGTTFDHFGLMNGMKPGGRLTVYFDDLHYLDQAEDFTHDPKWDASGNRDTYQTSEVAGAQNFGFSQTHFAGGAKAGEMGGDFWRTEGPVASYGDRVGPLSLDDKLQASGKLAFLAGAPDSGMYFGWFNSATCDQSAGLKDFVGVRIEGPTRIGHYFAPCVAGADGLLGKLEKAPVLVPGQKPRNWSIEYDPKANNGNGAVTVHLDDESATLNLKPDDHRNARLDRFGVFTPRIGGSLVKIYFDDVKYTATP